MLNLSILFLIFKRPDVTEQVFGVIRQVQPSRLYIAGDGARSNQPGETEKVLRARQIVLDGIDWPCEVKTLFRDTNLGCRAAVSSAIDWFFEQEEEGIILEDDCLPDLTFFRFCEELLKYYRHDTRIMAISGNNFQQGHQRGKYSYFFSQIPYCWGWATWRRAWCMYNITLENFKEIMSEPACKKFTHNDIANRMWEEKIAKAYNKKIDSWAFLWNLANFVNNGLTVVPQVNLVTNIGFGIEATHTINKDEFLSIKSIEFSFPLYHPPYICIDKIADDFVYDKYFFKKKVKKFNCPFFINFFPILHEKIFSKKTEKNMNFIVHNSSLYNKDKIRMKSNCYLKIDENSQIEGNIFLEKEGACVSIGKRVFCGGIIVCADNISIGNDVLISWGVTIIDHNSHSTIFSERANDVVDHRNGRKDWRHVKTRPIKIESKSWIGFNSIILKGVTIGEGAVVGAGSVVTKDVPAWTIVAGNPAAKVRTLSEKEI